MLRAGRVLVFVSMAGMWGCARYHARPLDPLRLEQQYRSRRLTDPGFRAFAGEAGQSALDLRRLTLAAFYYSPDLAVARAHLEGAEAAVASARARPNPQIGIDQLLSNWLVVPFFFHFENGFPIEVFGKRGYRTLEAMKLAEAARLEVMETAWRLRSRVRNALRERLFALREIQLLAEEETLRSESVQLLRARLAVGEVSRPIVDVAEGELSAARLNLRAAEGQASQTLAALAGAVGVPLAAIQDASLAAKDFADLPGAPPADKLQTAGLLNRIDVNRLLAEYAAAEAALRLEIAKQYPDVLLSPEYYFEERRHLYQISPVFDLPIFDRNRGSIAGAIARRKETEMRFIAAQAQAISEMEMATAQYNSALAELAQARDQLTILGERREPAMERAVQLGEEDRLALAGVRVQRAVAARAELAALRKGHAALAALEDAVEQPLEPDAAPFVMPPIKPRRGVKP
jgi:outer membrane protein TolC